MLAGLVCANKIVATAKMNKYIFVFCVILLTSLTSGCGGQRPSVETSLPPNSLFIKIDQEIDDTGLDPKIIRARLVEVNFELLGGPSVDENDFNPGDRLTLNLFEDVVFEAVLEKVEVVIPGSLTWSGILTDVDHGRATLAFGDQVLSGEITMPSVLFRIRYVGDGLHAIYEIDPSGFPPEAEPLEEG